MSPVEWKSPSAAFEFGSASSARSLGAHDGHGWWPTRAQFAEHIERTLGAANDRTTTRAERLAASSEIGVIMSQSRYPSERRHDAYEAFEPLAELRRELLGTEP